MQRTGRKRFGLVSPYLGDVQCRIQENYARNGYECVAERHLGERVNFAFSEVPPERIKQMVREVAADGAEVVLTFCTNLRAAQVVQELEDELGIPGFDTVSTAVRKSLRMCGVDTRRVRGWGSLFEQID
jgi:maleate isomerase